MSRLLRAPRFPVYDPLRHGNVFEWILKKTAEMRPESEEKKPKPRQPKRR